MKSEINKLFSIADLAYDNNDYEKSLLYYEKILSLNPRTAQAYLKIGNICLKLNAYHDALISYEQVVTIEKNNYVAYTNIGTVFQKNNQLQEAQEYYNKALDINPHYVIAHYNLSYVLLIQKNYLQGFKQYRYRYHKEIIGTKQGGVAYPPTLLTPDIDFSQKVLYISHEQGLGDTIEFIRYLPFFIKNAKKVICYVPPSLVKLFQLNYLDVDFIPPNSEISFDYNFPLLDAPYICKTEYKTIPFQDAYLHVNPNDFQAFQSKHKLNNKNKKIGINFKGSQGIEAVKGRSIELPILLEYLIPLQSTYDFYSLQYEQTSQEDELMKKHNIINLGQSIENFYDTALMIESMDLVISIDTSFLHLAGALGKKSFALLKFNPDWRWGLQDEHINWYSSMTLLRQSSENDWSVPLEKLINKLESEDV